MTEAVKLKNKNYRNDGCDSHSLYNPKEKLSLKSRISLPDKEDNESGYTI